MKYSRVFVFQIKMVKKDNIKQIYFVVMNLNLKTQILKNIIV